MNSSTATLPLFRRLIAVLGIGLVLMLGSAAASAKLHSWLHASGSDEASDQCAVVLFASGITFALAVAVVAAPVAVWHESAPRSVREIFLAPSRYLRQPERGPPGC